MPEGFRNADKEPHGLAKKPGHQPQQGYSLNEILREAEGSWGCPSDHCIPQSGAGGWVNLGDCDGRH